MNYKYEKNIYDDGNIPEIDLPQDTSLPPTQNHIGNGKDNDSGRNGQDPSDSSILDIPVTPPVLLKNRNQETSTSHWA